MKTRNVPNLLVTASVIGAVSLIGQNAANAVVLKGGATFSWGLECFNDSHVLNLTEDITLDTWVYSSDASGDASGGYDYDIGGTAVHESADKITIVFNGNLDLAGKAKSGAQGGSIGYGDLFINLTGNNFSQAQGQDKLFGMRFAGSNDSSMATTGLYSGVTGTSVTQYNYGYSSLNSYNNQAPNTNRVYGDFTENQARNYFNFSERPRNVIGSGNFATGITRLNLGELQSLGFNTNQFAGDNTYAFQFDKYALDPDAQEQALNDAIDQDNEVDQVADNLDVNQNLDLGDNNTPLNEKLQKLKDYMRDAGLSGERISQVESDLLAAPNKQARKNIVNTVKDEIKAKKLETKLADIQNKLLTNAQAAGLGANTDLINRINNISTFDGNKKQEIKNINKLMKISQKEIVNNLKHIAKMEELAQKAQQAGAGLGDQFNNPFSDEIASLRQINDDIRNGKITTRQELKTARKAVHQDFKQEKKELWAVLKENRRNQQNDELAGLDETSRDDWDFDQDDPNSEEVPEPITGVVLGGAALAGLMRKQRQKNAK